MSLTIEDKRLYVEVCQFIGSFTSLIQGSGGNFSVKSVDELMIKSSGKRIRDTTNTNGFVICDIHTLRTLDRIEPVVGSDNPSMEVFFHLLPSKWIFHFHPTFMMNILCSEQWNTITFPAEIKTLFIPYSTPGIDLSKIIVPQYTDESLIVLQNHGIIICSDTIHTALTLLDTIYSTITKTTIQFTKMFDFVLSIQPKVCKPCNTLQRTNILFDKFYPISPDIYLFLKNKPNVWPEPYQSESVVFTPTMVFVVGNSLRQCECIEEILISYVEICSSCDINTLHCLHDQELTLLTTSTSEINRINNY